MKILGIFHSYSDPSAALLRDGRVVAFAEEERFVRVKHATRQFPIRAVRYVLGSGGIGIDNIDCIAQAWDCPAYDDGTLAAVYDRINRRYPTTEADLAYQRKHLQALSSASQCDIILQNMRREFGDIKFPPVKFVRHHLTHACMAHFHSGFDEALVLTIDGSGEWTTTAWWHGYKAKLDPLGEVTIPHSLGWLYSAFTEYLGFRAYDGEYKVMGLAAYGKPNAELAGRVAKIAWYDNQGGFETDPMLLSRGRRRYSYYYPDTLAEHLARPPRAETEEINDWHMSLAYEVQCRLEDIVEEMVAYWTGKTGLRKLAIAGGVGLNIKMNARLFRSGLVDDVFIHPLCADAGVSIGAAMALEHMGGHGPADHSRLKTVSWGPEFSDEEIEKTLKTCKQSYTKEDAIHGTVARLLAEGKVVGWFQGRMEGGPRALGNRSILADPRDVGSRDRVNAVIKFREFWRPFCPSMTEAGAKRYLKRFTDAPFMILAFDATDNAKREVPAVVHVDDTVRVQIVNRDDNPVYYRLLESFEKLTGVPCVLNTSFNVKGEPIVCIPQDAIRTFSATGLDALAIGSFLLRKPGLT